MMKRISCLMFVLLMFGLSAGQVLAKDGTTAAEPTAAQLKAKARELGLTIIDSFPAGVTPLEVDSLSELESLVESFSSSELPPRSDTFADGEEGATRYMKCTWSIRAFGVHLFNFWSDAYVTASLTSDGEPYIHSIDYKNWGWDGISPYHISNSQHYYLSGNRRWLHMNITVKFSIGIVISELNLTISRTEQLDCKR